MLVDTYRIKFEKSFSWSINALTSDCRCFVELFAKTSGFERVLSYKSDDYYQCTVSNFDELESFRLCNRGMIEIGRKHFYRFFYTEDYKFCRIFLNNDEITKENMKLLFAISIKNAMQIQLMSVLDCVPCHCALIEINGCGAVICAPGNTGKTTSASRISEAGYKSYSDDYAILYVRNGKIIAKPMPTWSRLLNGDLDYTSDSSPEVELSAVFLLKQSTSDYIENPSMLETVNCLNSSLQDLFAGRTITDMPDNFRRRLRTNIFKFAHKMLDTLPVYVLHATLHGSFWEEMDRVMNGKKR